MNITWRRITLRPKYVFSTSRGSTVEKQVGIVALEHDGATGYGEIVAADIYGQSLDASEAALEKIRRDAVADPATFDPFAIEPWIDYLIKNFDAQRALIAAMDSALYDWVGKKLGAPVWRLLGLRRPQVTTTFTIGVADPEETKKKIDEAVAAGYTALKIKVGTSNDAQTLRAVREKFAGPILLDANEGWSPDEAAARIQSLAPFRPTMIEQPVPREHWKAMSDLRRLGVAPIFADESCERPADVVRLHGAVDGINIKLNKCGGIRQALRMVTLARELGMGVMVGCFVSSSLAIAPALAFASLVDYADLDGHLLLAEDPYAGLGAKGSRLSMSDEPGFGLKER